MKFFSTLITTLALGFSAFAHSPQWSLQQTTSGWNDLYLVKAYFHNSELQRQWAWELMGNYPLKGNEAILDFGCGDGKISAEISRLVPQGSVLGVDISNEMLHFAQIKFPPYAYPNLAFKKANSLIFNDFPIENSYDRIFSFCVFHQIAQPLEVLKNLKCLLKKEGQLLLVVPAGKNSAFFSAANEMFVKYQLNAPWKNQPASNGPSMRTIEGCSTLLKESGFFIYAIKMVDTDNPFYDKEELVDYMIGTTTANWSIPVDICRPFFNDLIERMCQIDPEAIDSEGRVHFKLSRIHVVAGLTPQNI